MTGQQDDPTAEAGAKLTQTVVAGAMGSEALAQVQARRAQQRTDEHDRHTRGLRVQARAEQAAAMLGKSGQVSRGQTVPESERAARFDATGEPMPSPAAVVVVESEVAGRGYAGRQGCEPRADDRQQVRWRTSDGAEWALSEHASPREAFAAFCQAERSPEHAARADGRLVLVGVGRDGSVTPYSPQVMDDLAASATPGVSGTHSGDPAARGYASTQAGQPSSAWARAASEAAAEAAEQAVAGAHVAAATRSAGVRA
jgi:hypothetical protein